MNQIFWYECGGSELRNRLVGYYKFENNVIDSTGLLPTATTNVVYTSGKIGQAANFDAFSRVVDIPDTDFLSFTTGGGNDVPFSMSIWVLFNSFSSTGNWIINKRTNASGGDEWHLVYSTSLNRLVFVKFDRTNSANIQGIQSPASPFSLSTWYHIVYTDDGTKTNAGMKMYINGVLQTTTNLNSGTYTGMPNGSSITRMGDASFGLSTLTRHNGYIDETAIWKNRILTQSEVTSLYNSGSGITYPF